MVRCTLDWSGPVKCVYSFDPSTVEVGRVINGTIESERAVENFDVEYFYEYEFDPTPSPGGFPGENESVFAANESPLDDSAAHSYFSIILFNGSAILPVLFCRQTTP